MQLKNNGLATWPQKGAKITLPRGPGLTSSHTTHAIRKAKTELYQLIKQLSRVSYKSASCNEITVIENVQIAVELNQFL